MILTLLRVLCSVPLVSPAIAQRPSGTATAKEEPAALRTMVVSLEDVQGLWGGTDIRVYSDDHCVIRRVSRHKDKDGLQELRFHGQLPAGESQRLLRLAASTGFFEYKQQRKTGVPDEAHPVVRIPLQGGGAFLAGKRAGEKDGRFDPLYAALGKLAASTKPGRIEYDGPVKAGGKDR